MTKAVTFTNLQVQVILGALGPKLIGYAESPYHRTFAPLLSQRVPEPVRLTLRTRRDVEERVTRYGEDFGLNVTRIVRKLRA